MCHHQSFLVDDCTSDKFEIYEKWVFSIFFASLTLKWPWCDIELTLVLCTSKAQLLLLLRFCWCLHSLQNSLICLPPTTLPTNSAVEMQVCPGVQWEKGWRFLPQNMIVDCICFLEKSCLRPRYANLTHFRACERTLKGRYIVKYFKFPFQTTSNRLSGA